MHWIILYPKRLSLALFWGAASFALGSFALVSVHTAFRVASHSGHYLKMATPVGVLKAVGVVLAAYVFGVLVSVSTMAAGVLAWREAVKVAQTDQTDLIEQGSHRGTED